MIHPIQMNLTQKPNNAFRRAFGEIHQVSLFTLGTMRAIGSFEQMYEVIKEARIAGINHIETAPAYGPAESFLGKALEKLSLEDLEPAGGWIITSKLLPGASLKEGQQQLRQMLKRLRRKKIENLAIHGLNLEEHLIWALQGEGADLLRWALEESLVEQVGFSSHGSNPLIQKAIDSGIFKFCSLHLHLLDPKRIPLAKVALEKGMGVMAISPADKGGRLQDPSEMLIKDCSPIHPLELAYRYLLSIGISTLTVGALKPKDLIFPKKLANEHGPLNELEQQSLEKLKEAQQIRLGTNLCGQCQACLPCPNNVPIPELLRLNNLLIGHDLEAYTKERYNLIGRAGHWWEAVNANACQKCEDCLPRCPKELPIPSILESIHKRLADKPRRRLWS